MANETKQPTVPPRNSFKKQPIFVKAEVSEIPAPPGKVRQWVEAVDKDHPNYVEKYLSSRQVGDDTVGYCTMDPWRVVQKTELGGARTRDDQGKGATGEARHGSMVLIETDADNAAVLTEYDRLRFEERKRQWRKGDREMSGPHAAYRARVAVNEQVGSHTDLLQGE